LQTYPLLKGISVQIIQTNYTILTYHSSALKPLLGLLVQRPDFDMHIGFDGPIPHSGVYRMSSAELEELKLSSKIIVT
jgi:hypothetical protein